MPVDAAAVLDAARAVLPGVERADVLAGGSHLKVHLAPLPVVARVASFGASAHETWRRELAVAAHLRDRGVPATYPTELTDPGPHPVGDTVFTLWQLVEIDPTAVITASELNAAHREFAAAMMTFPSELTPLPTWDGVMAVRRGMPLEHDVLHAAALAADLVDQRLLASNPSTWLPDHGDPHPGNLLSVGGRWLWCDFEEVCRAPRFWDVASAVGWTVLYDWHPEVTEELIRLRLGTDPTSVDIDDWHTALGARMCYLALLTWWMTTKGFPTQAQALAVAERAVAELSELDLWR